MEAPKSKIGIKIFSDLNNQKRKNRVLKEKGSLINEVFSFEDQKYKITSFDYSIVDRKIESFKSEIDSFIR